jgi:hypothetical protein
MFFHLLAAIRRSKSVVRATASVTAVSTKLSEGLIQQVDSNVSSKKKGQLQKNMLKEITNGENLTIWHPPTVSVTLIIVAWVSGSDGLNDLIKSLIYDCF